MLIIDLEKQIGSFHLEHNKLPLNELGTASFSFFFAPGVYFSG